MSKSSSSQGIAWCSLWDHHFPDYSVHCYCRLQTDKEITNSHTGGLTCSKHSSPSYKMPLP